MSEAFICEVADGVAIIAINRPKVMNAFCGRTCDELIHACNRAGWDKSVGVIVLTAYRRQGLLHRRALGRA